MQSYLPKNPADWKGTEHIAAAAGLPTGYGAGAHDGMPPLVPLSLQDQLLLMRGAGMKRSASMSSPRSRANSSPGAAPPGHGMGQPQTHQTPQQDGETFQHLTGGGGVPQGDALHPLPPLTSPPPPSTHQNPPLTPGSRHPQVFHSPPPMEHEPPAKRMHHDSDLDPRPSHLPPMDIPTELGRHITTTSIHRHGDPQTPHGDHVTPHGDQTPPELTQEEIMIQNHNNNNIKMEVITQQVTISLYFKRNCFPLLVRFVLQILGTILWSVCGPTNFNILVKSLARVTHVHLVNMAFWLES